MSQSKVDRELVLLLLAFQNNMIDRTSLIDVFGGWQKDRTQPLPERLVAYGAITTAQLELLEAIGSQFLARFDGDVEKSLAHISGVASSVQDELRTLSPSEMQATLSLVRQAVDPIVNSTQRVGESSSSGSRFRILRPHGKVD